MEKNTHQTEYFVQNFEKNYLPKCFLFHFSFRKCVDRATCPDYYKNVLARACGGAAILGVLILLTLYLNPRRRSAVRTI